MAWVVRHTFLLLLSLLYYQVYVLSQKPNCQPDQIFCPALKKCMNKGDIDQCPPEERPECLEGQFFCPTLKKCMGEDIKDQCPEGRNCSEREFFCPTLKKCMAEEIKDQCPVGRNCSEREFFCPTLKKCMAEEIKDQCPREERPECPEGKKRCRSAPDKSGCIGEKELCDCGEGMEYCKTKQRCMSLEQLKSGFDCPLDCDVEGERFCSFTNTCIPHKKLCSCPADKRGCATLKSCIASDEICPCPSGHTHCKSTWACLPDDVKCPVCKNGEFYCEFQKRCVATGTPCGCPKDTEYCPYRMKSDIPLCVNVTKKDMLCRCAMSEKPCLTLLKCIPRDSKCPCPEGTHYCPESGDCTKEECFDKSCHEGKSFCPALRKCISDDIKDQCPEGRNCSEREFFCRTLKKCMAEDIKDQCPREERPECPEGKKRCRSAPDGSGCIGEKELCDCGKGMEYCKTKQRCMSLEQLKSGFDCPLDCDVEGERFCSFTKTCIPHKKLCSCPADKRGCATLKSCIASDEICPCPSGHTHCKSTWACLPDDVKCPVCKNGEFYCEFQKRCVATGTPCGCPKDTKYCPYRMKSDIPLCVNVTKKDMLCRCAMSEKPCLTLLKCIPRDSKCPCPEGTHYCPESGDCTKEECFDKSCHEGKSFCPALRKCISDDIKDQCPEGRNCSEREFFCRTLKKCMAEDIKDQCPREERPECPEGKKRCRSAPDGSGCIGEKELCDCGKGMEYCKTKQRCMSLEQLKSGFDCPLDCDVEGERFCSFTKTCIPHKKLCSCPADKRGCATLKSCIASDEICPCPSGHTHCKSTWACLPDDVKCPVCKNGEFYCEFQKRCVATGTPCGCPKDTEYCPYRIKSDIPLCVNVTKKDMLCRCATSEKPCLTLLKCIPRDSKCPCPEGTHYCPESGDCTKEECFDKSCREGEDCSPSINPGDPTRPSRPTKTFFFYGVISSYFDDKKMVGKLVKDLLVNVEFQEAVFEGQINIKIGVWQIGRTGESGWTEVTKQTKITNRDKLRYKPGNGHGLDGIKLKIGEQSKTIGVLVNPCVQPKLEMKKRIVEVIEDIPVRVSVDELLSITRVNNGGKEPNLPDEYVKLVPEKLIQNYKELLNSNYGENLGVLVAGVKFGVVKEDKEVEVEEQDKKSKTPFSRLSAYKPMILSTGSKFFFVPQDDYFGEAAVDVVGVDIPSTTENLRKVVDICAIGKDTHRIIFNVTNVNDRPTVRLGFNRKPMLNIRVPPMPYKDNVQELSVINLAKMGEDKDRDSLGVGIVKSKKTKLGQWQYRTPSNEEWQNIEINVQTNDEGVIEGDTVQLLFLSDECLIRFKQAKEVKVWSNIEAMDHTEIRFVLWDQTDQLSPGLHTVTRRGNTAISMKVISAIIRKNGCNDREGSMKIINECGECGKKSCKKCDGNLNSTAVFSDCNNTCVLGSTNKPLNYGRDCFGMCGGIHILDRRCNKCHKPGRPVSDCAGNCGGAATINRCNVCSADPNEGADECGVCNGNGSSCAGCDGVPNSKKIIDLCNKCRSRKDKDFNKGCVSLGVISPYVIPAGQAVVVKVVTAGIPNNGVMCSFYKNEADPINVGVTVHDDGKSMKLNLPEITNIGKYDLRCTVNGIEYNGHSVYVFDEITVNKIEPNEIDVDDEVTEVLVHGTGFIDTGSVACVFRRETTLRSSKQTDTKRHLGEFISNTKIKCKLSGYGKVPGQIDISVASSRTASPASFLPLTWFAKAPRVAGYKLASRSISIRFNVPVKKVPNCNELFAGQTIQILNELVKEIKKGFKCVFRQSNVLVIKLFGPVDIENNITLNFNDGVIKADFLYSRTSSHRVTIVGQGKKTLPSPIAVINSPVQVGQCDKIRISGRESKNIQVGGDYFKCFWSVSVENETSLAENIKTDLANIREKLALNVSVKKCLVKLDSTNMKSDTIYTIKLKVKNRNGDESEEVSREIRRNKMNVPSLQWKNFPRTLNLSTGRYFKFDIQARAPKCVNRSQLSFLWSSPSHPDLVLDNSDKRRLTLKREILTCGETYTITVRAFMASDRQRYSNLTKHVRCVGARLKVKIRGGSRVIPSNGTFVLKSKINDKAVCGDKMVYLYSCFDEENKPCVVTNDLGERKLLTLSKGEGTKLSARQFTSNKKYTFKLEVSKGDQIAEDSVDITIVAGDPPVVKITKVKKTAKKLMMFAIIKSKASKTLYQWKCVKEVGFGCIDSEDNTKMQGSIDKPVNRNVMYSKKLSLVFPSDVFEGVVVYKYELSAYPNDSPDDIGLAWLTITPNIPPIIDDIIIEPREGVSLSTKFTFTAIALSSENLRISYKFFAYKKHQKKEGHFSTILLGDKSDFSSIEVELPPGDKDNADELTVGVIVQDELGLITKKTTTIKVTQKVFDPTDLEKVTESSGPLEAMGVLASIIASAEEGNEGEDLNFDDSAMEISDAAAAEVEGPDEVASYLGMSNLLEPSSNDAKAHMSSNLNSVVEKAVPPNVKKEFIKPKAFGGSRKRRATEEEKPASEDDDDESAGLGSEEAESALSAFENFINTAVINNVTKDFLETVENLLISMCQNLPHGDMLTAYSSTLGILRSHMSYMDDVDETFLNVSAVHGLINHSALVKFGSHLKNLYSEWNCSSEDEMCNGVCAAMVQYPHDFITADNSSKRRGDVVHLAIKNPVTLDHIVVEGLTTNVVVQIPLRDGSDISQSYKCKIWDRITSEWSATACQTLRVFTKESALFAECGCSSLGYITVDIEDLQGSTAQPSTQPPTTGLSSTQLPPSSTESGVQSTAKTTKNIHTQNIAMTTEANAFTASVWFSFNEVYNSIVTNTATKKALEKNIEDEVATTMKVSKSMILNLTISEGSIVVTFVLLAPDQNPSTSLNYSITKLQLSIDKSEFVVPLPDGGQITADQGTVSYNYKMVSGATPEPTTAINTKNNDDDSNLPLLLGCVFGVLLLIIAVIVGVVYKKHVANKSKVSHQNIRLSQPIENTFAENPAYHGSKAFNMADIELERPTTGGSRGGSAGVRQAAQLPAVQ